MSTRNELFTQFEALGGNRAAAKRMSNDQLREAVEAARAEKERADATALQLAVEDSPEIRNRDKLRHPLQVAPGGSLICARGMLGPGDEVRPDDGEIAKLVAHGKVVTGPGFVKSMLEHSGAARE